MSFRIQGNSFFLTYSQCNLEPQVLLDHLKTLQDVKFIGIGQEHHQDGNLHLHVLINFSKRKNIQTPRYFDLNGFHPSVEKTRSQKGAKDYYRKEGYNVLEFGEEEEEEVEDIYTLAGQMDRSDFFNYCRKKKIAFQYANDAWVTSQTTVPTIDEAPTEGTVNEMLNWYVPRIPFKATVLVGPTGCGKTVYAKRNATKPILFCSHIDDLKSFNPRKHKSIIFDDMSFKHYPVQAQIHLVDLFDDRSINVKHSIARIPKNTERWVTCNEFPFTEHEAIRRRINLINLY